MSRGLFQGTRSHASLQRGTSHYCKDGVRSPWPRVPSVYLLSLTLNFARRSGKQLFKLSMYLFSSGYARIISVARRFQEMTEDVFLFGQCLLMSFAFSIWMALKGWLLVGEVLNLKCLCVGIEMGRHFRRYTFTYSCED